MGIRVKNFYEASAVIDFETTGLSPNDGARAIEVAAVIIQDGQIIGRYQSLMNAGISVPVFITSLTGITTSMVKAAPSSKKVLQELKDFIGAVPIVAHNASFDRKFLTYECSLSGIRICNEFACSMLISRRLFPECRNHKLGTIVDTLNIQKSGNFHRALADAEMTARLLMKIQEKLTIDFGIDCVTHELLRKLQKVKYAGVNNLLTRYSDKENIYPQKVYLEADFQTNIRSNFTEENSPTHRNTAKSNIQRAGEIKQDSPAIIENGHPEAQGGPLIFGRWAIIALIAYILIWYLIAR